jgi:hypothetical protein
MTRQARLAGSVENDPKLLSRAVSLRQLAQRALRLRDDLANDVAGPA